MAANSVHSPSANGMVLRAACSSQPRRRSCCGEGSQASAKNQPTTASAPHSEMGATPSSSNSQPSMPSGVVRWRPSAIDTATSSTKKPQKRTAGPMPVPPTNSTTRLSGRFSCVVAFTPGRFRASGCVW